MLMTTSPHQFVRVCVRACVRACVRVCVRACERDMVILGGTSQCGVDPEATKCNVPLCRPTGVYLVILELQTRWE